MVWHCVVLPGTHTVTVVYSVLTEGPASPAGPPSTTTDSTLDTAGAFTVTVADCAALPPAPAQVRV